MELDNLLKILDDNQQKIEGHGVLNAEIQKRINYKFRLDWNYYSNSMEGNSLTRIETKQLMMDNVTIDGKPFKDIAEMRGHDSEVLEIFKIGKGELRIAESRIKKMHKAVMHEDDPLKQIQIGEWKTSDNYLINYRGERLDFLPHTEVREAIHALLNETNASIDQINRGSKDSMHPAIVGFHFHLEYLRIHPFYDGNGRTGRLLMNLILISFGFPPVILRQKEKELYYKLLSEIQGYGADPKQFYVFMCKLLIESQQLVLDAIEGKSIEEDDDVDKEIKLWKQQLKGEQATVEHRTEEAVIKTYKDSIKPLFGLYIDKFKQFEDMFLERQVFNRIGNRSETAIYTEFFDNWIGYKLVESESEKGTFDDVTDEVAHIASRIHNDENKFHQIRNENELELEIQFKGFKNNGVDAFDEHIGFKIHFDRYNYRIEKDRFSRKDYFKKLYSEKLTEQEINQFVIESVKDFFEILKTRVKPI